MALPREIHPLDPQPHRYCMLASTASAPGVTRCSLGLYWSCDLCSKHACTGWLGDVILSRSDSERQRNLMIHDQCPLPVYFSQALPYARALRTGRYSSALCQIPMMPSQAVDKALISNFISSTNQR